MDLSPRCEPLDQNISSPPVFDFSADDRDSLVFGNPAPLVSVSLTMTQPTGHEHLSITMLDLATTVVLLQFVSLHFVLQRSDVEQCIDEYSQSGGVTCLQNQRGGTRSGRGP